MRSAIGVWLAALFVGILTYWVLGDVPKIGGVLETLGWIVTIGLVLYGIYLLVVGHRGRV